MMHIRTFSLAGQLPDKEFDKEVNDYLNGLKSKGVKASEITIHVNDTATRMTFYHIVTIIHPITRQ